MRRDFRWMLPAKCLLLNATAFALLAVAYVFGYLDEIIRTDTTHICALIFALMLLGVALAFSKALWLSRELDGVEGTKADEFVWTARRAKADARDRLAGVYKLQLQQRLSWVRYLGGIQVMLGLFGTVIGFWMALLGVDPNAISDVSMISRIVATLISGLGLAITTTIVGTAGNIWIMLNYRVLENAAASALTRAIKRAEGVR